MSTANTPGILGLHKKLSITSHYRQRRNKLIYLIIIIKIKNKIDYCICNAIKFLVLLAIKYLSSYDFVAYLCIRRLEIVLPILRILKMSGKHAQYFPKLFVPSLFKTFSQFFELRKLNNLKLHLKIKAEKKKAKGGPTCQT